MPSLGWSARAQAVTTGPQRQQLTNLFNAYFRVGFPQGREVPSDSVLPLDLPTETGSRYYFVAQYISGKGWWAEAKLRRPDLAIQFGSSRPKHSIAR